MKVGTVIYAVVGTTVLSAALVFIILTGHDTAGFVAAVLALSPVFYGVIAALTKINSLQDQTHDLQTQTNGNHAELTGMLASAQNELATSVPIANVAEFQTVPQIIPIESVTGITTAPLSEKGNADESK